MASSTVGTRPRHSLELTYSTTPSIVRDLRWIEPPAEIQWAQAKELCFALVTRETIQLRRGAFYKRESTTNLEELADMDPEESLYKERPVAERLRRQFLGTGFQRGPNYT